jgi:hypothetical protein
MLLHAVGGWARRGLSDAAGHDGGASTGNKGTRYGRGEAGRNSTRMR